MTEAERETFNILSVVFIPFAVAFVAFCFYKAAAPNDSANS